MPTTLSRLATSVLLAAALTCSAAAQNGAPESGIELPPTQPVTRSGGFGIGTVRRTLERGRASNERLGVSVVASRRPARGERVSVIPLQPGLVGAQLVIRSVDLFENPLNDSRPAGAQLPDYWQLEFEDNINLTILASSGIEARTGESSVEVAVLFPASPRARALDPSTIPPGDLPDGFTVDALKVAIDADGDRVADFVVFDTGQTFTYERVSGRWQLIDVMFP